MNNTDNKNLGEQFTALPENIRKWLASEELVFIVSEIETKLGLSDEKILVIPNLILRLVVQDIAPQDFIGELSKELGVEFPVAKTIAEDIEKKALRPIELELRNKLGLEIKLIYYGKTESGKKEFDAPALRFKPTSAPTEIKPEIKRAAPIPEDTRPIVDLQSFKIKSPVGQAGQAPKLAFAPTIKGVTPTEQPGSQNKIEEAPMVPFILHQESPTSAPTLNQSSSAGSSLGIQGSSLPKTSLTMKVQNYFQSAGISERAVSAPISIKVETPAAQQAITQSEQKITIARQPAPPIPKPEVSPASSQALSPTAVPASQPSQTGPIPSAGSAGSGQARVVNYSSLRTPLNTVGLPKKEPDKNNIVDLRKF